MPTNGEDVEAIDEREIAAEDEELDECGATKVSRSGSPNPGPRPTPPAARIRSLEDFDRVVAKGGTPLNKLAPETRRIFRDSLIFNDRGLTTYQYPEIRAALTPAEYDRVRALFGLVQRRLSADHEGYECVSRATCAVKERAICIGNNC